MSYFNGERISDDPPEKPGSGLDAEIYFSRKSGLYYRQVDGKIDLDNPLQNVDLSRYRKSFNYGNLIYDVYKLKP